MFDQLSMAKNIEEQIALQGASMTANDRYEPPYKLDGSIEAMHQCLETLAELTCQDMNQNTVPVIEFQFGDIVTMTSLLRVGNRGYLSITALLPRLPDDLPQSTSQLTTSTVTENTHGILWHADKGCYVITRKLPVSSFADERAVLDAIADTADDATALQASMSTIISGVC